MRLASVSHPSSRLDVSGTAHHPCLQPCSLARPCLQPCSLAHLPRDCACTLRLHLALAVGIGVKATVGMVPAGWSQRSVLSAGFGIGDGMMAWGERLLKCARMLISLCASAYNPLCACTFVTRAYSGADGRSGSSSPPSSHNFDTSLSPPSTPLSTFEALSPPPRHLRAQVCRQDTCRPALPRPHTLDHRLLDRQRRLLPLLDRGWKRDVRGGQRRLLPL